MIIGEVPLSELFHRLTSVFTLSVVKLDCVRICNTGRRPQRHGAVAQHARKISRHYVIYYKDILVLETLSTAESEVCSMENICR